MPDWYEVVEHTADIGIRAWGRTLGDAFANAAMGMMSLIIPEHGLVLEKEKRPVKASAADLEGLLVAWLEELVYLVDAERFLVARVEDISIATPGTAGTGLHRGHAARPATDAATDADLRGARGGGARGGGARGALDLDAQGSGSERCVQGATETTDVWEVSALVWGEGIDPARHPLEIEIKGVSYHMLRVERIAGPSPSKGRAASPAPGGMGADGARGAACGRDSEVGSDVEGRDDSEVWMAQAIFDV